MMSTNGRKSAVVAQGLGAAIAQYLAADRFNVLINSASQSKFLRTAAAIIAAVVFLLDALTSLDIAIAVLYVLVVLLSLNFATQRREAENQLRAARTELAHVARVATLGELTVSIAHELNQPLAAVVTNGGAGLRWLKRDVPDLEKVQSSMEGMIADAQRASDIIKNLRALSVKAPPKPIHINLNEVLDETVALVRREIDINQVSLRFDLAADLPEINGDRVQLQQVILNLLLNAIQAMAHVAGNTRKLLIETFAEEQSALVKIHDNGPGLTPETRKKLFSPFYTTKPDGMGMGLSICRSIVNAHGGSISASSEPGSGTTFEFTIPLKQGTG
ncbi:sensor histidine kinase [Phyllobacterium chamaecytisi]|uniref:sensor histidine kinase n=1 Tax=Phyllobacterium chamaecytisi TaxID=2876082 RepID=UPI001CCDFEE5|nr:ATP-binding protein [Phyllobacterium sp. KW56]MBZ9605733.1 GHKL domain-containing protein [Phyllobacterium sp. KW56]